MTDKIIKCRTYWKFELSIQICPQYAYKKNERLKQLCFESLFFFWLFYNLHLINLFKIYSLTSRLFFHYKFNRSFFLTFELLDYLFVRIWCKNTYKFVRNKRYSEFILIIISPVFILKSRTTYLYKKNFELDFSMGLINFANRLFINF